MRIDEQKARIELAQLQRGPAPPPPPPSAASATASPGDRQCRAMAAALNLKSAQVRVGRDDPVVDSALVQLGAVNREVAIAEETRKQEALQADLRAVEERRKLAPSKVIPFDPAAVVRKIRERAELGVRASKGDKDYNYLLDGFTLSALKETYEAGYLALYYGQSEAAYGRTDQNPPSVQWGDFGWPVQGRFWA